MCVIAIETLQYVADAIINNIPIGTLFVSKAERIVENHFFLSDGA